MSNATFTAEQISEEFQVLKRMRGCVSNIVTASATKSAEHCRDMAQAQIGRLTRRLLNFKKMLDAAQGLERIEIEGVGIEGVGIQWAPGAFEETELGDEPI